MKNSIKILAIFLLSSCSISNENIVQSYPQNPYIERKQRAGNIFGNENGIILFGKISSNNIQNNNNNLWQKSIEKISQILPISIINDESGLISTDWGTIQNISNNNNLYKINAIVKGEKIDKNNLEISVFKKENSDVILDIQVQEKIKNIILY